MTRTAILIAIAAFAATAATAEKPYDGRGTGPSIGNPPAAEWEQCDPSNCSPRAKSAANKQPDRIPPELKRWLDLPSPLRSDPKQFKPAADQRILPPVQYDRPYNGQLLVMKLASNKDAELICPPTTFPVKACAVHPMTKRKDGSWTSCVIYMPVDAVILEAGYTPDAVYRHELGHCNGWADDHKGARVAL